ncbi:hypothetical protein [Mesorhizobium sp. B4-1-3]|uniref:hypothetical protein n=1 Tax=Mesorhizobium sp. B4-1-3 TaxID=2589889 RepID=UPI0015E47520|nr:hypothetical protein [Mesorhizobium sp. B4-1-3]
MFLFGQWTAFFLSVALGCPDLPFAAASFEWADIAGAAPVFLADVDVAAAFFGAACSGAPFFAGLFFGSSLEEKMPVMLSRMDMVLPSVEFDKTIPTAGKLFHVNQLPLMEQQSPRDIN